MKRNTLLLKAIVPILLVWSLWKLADMCIWASGVFNRASGWLHVASYPMTDKVDLLSKEYLDGSD